MLFLRKFLLKTLILLKYSIDCRLISPETKFKFTEGLDSEAGFDFYNISFSPFYGMNLLIKHILDKLLSLFFIILLSPLLIIVSMLILLEDGFPIIFKQKRKEAIFKYLKITLADYH